MNNTPETDRRIITQNPRMCGCGYKSEIVFADFARRLERERDEARSDLEFRRGLYKLQTEQLNNANLRVERTRAYLEEIKSERDLWKIEAERWRDCGKP